MQEKPKKVSIDFLFTSLSNVDRF